LIYVSNSLSDTELLRLLADDVPFGDLTTDSLGMGALLGYVVFQARQPMRLCAIEEAARLFELAGANTAILLPSGSDAVTGDVLLRATGSAAALHRGWKVAQTMVEYASGIATVAAAIVAALRDAGFATPVACTRKNFPGTKAIAVKAVLAGGAVMHRLGLSETLLVFPEHLEFVPVDERAAALAELRRRCPEKKLVAEATSIDDAVALAGYGVDVLQLEKFSPEQVAACRAALAGRNLQPLLAAAGGVNVANAVAYARAGAELLVTSAPYFAKPADVKVTITRALDNSPG
jgi:molybdenum transport protein